MCVLNPHLQCGQHYLFHGGEVRLPEELSLLSEGQDLILVDGVHRGWNLQTTKSSQSALSPKAAFLILSWGLKCDDRKKTGPKDTLKCMKVRRPCEL